MKRKILLRFGKPQRPEPTLANVRATLGDSIDLQFDFVDQLLIEAKRVKMILSDIVVNCASWKLAHIYERAVRSKSVDCKPKFKWDFAEYRRLSWEIERALLFDVVTARLKYLTKIHMSEAAMLVDIDHACFIMNMSELPVERMNRTWFEYFEDKSNAVSYADYRRIKARIDVFYIAHRSFIVFKGRVDAGLLDEL